MRVGISTSSFYPMTIEDAVEDMIRHRVPVTEFFVNTISEISPEYLRELKKKTDAAGMVVRSLHPFTSAIEPFLFFTRYERRFADALEWHRGYFEAMQILGAKIFVFHGDRWRGGEIPPLIVSDEEYFERFAALRDLGREYGVVVAQENVSRCRSRDLDFLLRMRDYLDDDIAFVFDNKQAVRSGVEAEQWIRALGDRVVHVHISDNGPAGDCLSIGDGTLDIPALFSMLFAKGFDGDAVIELYRERLPDDACIFAGYERLCALLSKNTSCI